MDILCAELIPRISPAEFVEIQKWINQTVSKNRWFTKELLETALSSSLLQDVGRYVREVVLFEANNALACGFIDDTNPDKALESVRILFREQDFLSYLLEKYPLLSLRVAHRVKMIGDAIARMTNRFCRDVDEILKLIGALDRKFSIEHVEREVGDSHNAAETVTIITIRVEERTKRVVYKPRNISCECAFNRFLEWSNRTLKDTDLYQQPVTCIDKEHYGWMEFVEHLSITDLNGAKRYFRRYGALSAILDLLNTTDVHYENLIAHGEYPIVIDLETILQPHRIASNTVAKPVDIMDLEFFSGNVYFTAMYDPIFLNGSLDGSPLVAPKKILGQPSNLTFHTTEKKFFASHPWTKIAESHCAKLNDKFISSYEFAADIEAGFREMWKILLTQKSDLYNSFLEECFRGVSTRVIFRETARYTQLLEAIFSPYCFESLSNLNEFLLKLAGNREDASEFFAIFPFEYNDCLNGDIPFFSAHCSDQTITTSNGKINGLLLAKSGLEETKYRLLHINRKYVESASELIAYSLEMKRREQLDALILPSTKKASAIGIFANIDQIRSIIQNRVFVKNNRLFATDLTLANDLTTKHRVLGDDLYLGLPGIVLFAATCDQQRKGALQPDTLALCSYLFDNVDFSQQQRIGACVGTASLAYLALQIGFTCNDPLMLNLAEDLITKSVQLRYMDRCFDVFSGHSGAILVAASLFKATRSESSLKSLTLLTDSLLEHAERIDNALVWKSSIPSNGPITGFAHGAAGIGCALVRAYLTTQNKRFLVAAIGVHNFLELCRSPKHGWRDSLNGEETSLRAWCHGAPGISLFYKELVQAVPDNELYMANLATAVKITCESLEYENESLCHGSLGNAEALLSLPEKISQTYDTAGAIQSLLERVRTHPIRCGNVRKHQSLSLFTGIAGIGYQLLRLTSPRTAPSLLSFDILQKEYD